MVEIRVASKDSRSPSSEFPSILASNHAARVAEALNRLGGDIIEMEQYMDFLRNRMFRQTLLCHREVKLKRALGPWTPADFRIAASLRPLEHGPGDVETFAGTNDLRISASEPIVKAALATLGEAWPETIPFRELLERARRRQERTCTEEKSEPRDIEADGNALGTALLMCYTKGLCEFQQQPEQFVTSPEERPRRMSAGQTGGCPRQSRDEPSARKVASGQI